MELFAVNRFKSGSYAFPSADVDPEYKKSERYAQRVAEAMYHAYVTDKTAISVDRANYFQMLRLYGRGKQPTQQYRDALYGKGNNLPDQIDSSTFKDQKRKAWDNVDFDHVISYAQKIKDHFHGIFRHQDMDLIGNAIDEDSGMLVKDKKHELQTEMLFARDLAEIRELAGEEQPQMDFFPLDQAELEAYEASGGFKLNFAKAMEKLLKHTFEVSKYEQLKRNWIDDAIDLGIVAGRITEDVDTEETIVDYVDPANTIVQWSSYPDYRDSEYCGELKVRPLSELASFIEDRETLEKIAYQYSGYLGNPSVEYWTTYNVRDEGGGYAYDFYRIQILEGYYIDYEDNYEKEYTDKYGKRKVIPTRYGYEKKNNNEKVRVKRVRYLYKFNWVVDTDVVFDYGKVHNQERPDKKDVKLPYRFITVASTSIMERLKPVFDDMMFSWLKYQNAQVMAANAGYAVNVRLLKNIQLGSKTADPRELLKMMLETGYLFYSDGDEETGEGYKGGGVQPVQELLGGMRNQLEESITKFRFALELIEQETGLANLSMGGAQDQGKSATEARISEQGMQNITRPIIDGVMDLKGSLGESAMFNIQQRVSNEDWLVDRYAMVIGRKDVQAIIDANQRGARFGVHFEPRPSAQEISEIKQWVQGLTSAGKNGEPLLKADEALDIIEKLNNGTNLKDIRFNVQYKIKRREIEQQRNAERMQQMQAEQNQAFEQQKQQGELRKQQMEINGRLKEKQMDNENNLKVTNRNNNAKEKITLMELAAKEDERSYEELKEQMDKKQE